MPKCKYIVYCDEGYDENGKPVLNEICTLKNEKDAIRFVCDPQNTRHYSTMRLFKKEAGVIGEWDERKGLWVDSGRC